MDRKSKAIEKETIEAFLRSEMESGRIHLRVNPDPKFREEVVKNLGRFGKFDYVDPVAGTFSTVKKSWRFVLVDDLFNYEGEIWDEIIVEI